MWSLSLMFYRDKCVSFLLSKSVFRAPVTEYLLFPVKFQWILLFYSIFIHFAKWEGWLIPRRGSVTTPLKWLSAGLLSTQTKPDALAHPVHTFISAHKNREQTGLEDWGVREYQTPLCCGCHSLCLSESLFVLTLTRTKSLSTTTLACIVLIQIITRQLIYIYIFFPWSCFPKPNNLPHNRWCSLHSRREPCLICSAAVRLWNKLIDPENGQCGVSSSYRFAVKSRKFHILYLQANLVSVSMQFICSVYIYI